MKCSALFSLAITAIACCVPAHSIAATPCATLPQALAETLESHGWGSPGSYVAALHDLNGDGSPEAVILLTGRDWCGSGGCTLLVLRQRGPRWQLVSKTSIVRPPIRVLPGHQHGWPMLSVYVAGGGIIPGYTSILPFGKSGYPVNPTVSPAFHAHGAPTGYLLIGSYRCSSQGRMVQPNQSSKRTRGKSPRAA
jgi:hypothetical protein